MSEPSYNLLPTEIEGFDSLAELALDMRWSWNHVTGDVWRKLDPDLWEHTHNPWVVRQTVSRDQIKRVLADPIFRKDVDGLVEASRKAAKAPAWFQKNHSDAPLKCAAYFSMEFMLSEALPIYSGGLGNVAGDQLKAASDLGVAVVGVGLLYQQGYFRQVIDKDGAQQALYPYNDPGQLPITPLRQPNGEWLRLEIASQVGSFSERRWVEWNGRYRDDVRRFWRGDDGMLGLFASRICGSADIYSRSGKGPEGSINFVTCHDGFTLNDLVSYRDKHNEANGENNHDGAGANFSENYSAEGETKDAVIETVRKRQIKNFLLTLFISRGASMLLGGDEFRRAQGGNNNAYCQDNETSWYDWCDLERHREIYHFVKGMIAFRGEHPVLSKEQFYTDVEIHWFGPQGGLPNWADSRRKDLACMIHENGRDALLLMFNASTDGIDFGLPALPQGIRWHLAVNTSRSAPQDLFTAGEEMAADSSKPYNLEARSSAIFVARKQVA